MSATEHTAHGSQPEQDDELTTVVRDLADRIEALQADVRRLGGPGLPAVEPGWDGEVAVRSAAPSYAWVSSVGAPVRRRRAVPRLFLEVLFLVGVAVGAAVAELDAPVIAGLMAGSWVLVALIEWAGSRADRRRDAVPHIEPIAPAEPAAGRPVMVRAAGRAHVDRACCRLAACSHAPPAGAPGHRQHDREAGRRLSARRDRSALSLRPHLHPLPAHSVATRGQASGSRCSNFGAPLHPCYGPPDFHRLAARRGARVRRACRRGPDGLRRSRDQAPVRVTFVGDSVPASISYTPQAQAILSRGVDLRLDLRVCRRLVTESCSFQGATPPTALQSVQARRPTARRRAHRRRRLQRVGRRLPARESTGSCGPPGAGCGRRRLGDAARDARHLPADERRDSGRAEALAAAAGRRLERLQPRQAVVLVRRAPHGRRPAPRRWPAFLRPFVFRAAKA